MKVADEGLRSELESLGQLPVEGGLLTVEAGYVLEDVQAVLAAVERDASKVYLAYPGRISFLQKLLNLLFWFIHSKRLRDVQSGLRYYPPEVVERMGTGTHPMEVLIGVVRMNVVIEEIMVPFGQGGRSSSTRWDLLYLLRTFIRYLMSSFASFVVDITIFQLLIFVLAREDADIRIWTATISARVVSSVVNFLINKKLVFQNDDGIGVPALKYFSLVIAEMLSSGFFVTVIYSVIRIPETAIKLLVDLALFFTGYIIEKVFIFDQQK